EGGLPHIGSIDVAAKPSGDRVARREVEKLDRGGIDTGAAQVNDHQVVCRRSERSGSGFADEILRFLDVLARSHHERFDGAEHVEDENAAVTEPAPDTDRGGWIADAAKAELVGGNRAIDVAARAELHPLDRDAHFLLVYAERLAHELRVDQVEISDRDLVWLLLCRSAVRQRSADDGGEESTFACHRLNSSVSKHSGEPPGCDKSLELPDDPIERDAG